jgi:hypothetical protein
VSESRTIEQREADAALTAAVEAVNRAYYGEDGRLLTDYIVVFAEQSWDNEGEQVTAVGVSPRDGDMPIYRTLGLLDYALTRARQRLAEDIGGTS